MLGHRVQDAYITPFETPIAVAVPGFVANDTLECEPYTIVITGPPGDGSLADNGGGGFDYTPNSGFYGYDEFPYEIHDANQQIMANSLVILVVENPLCVANDDAYVTPADTTLTLGGPGVLGNDFVCPDFIDLAVAQAPSHGSATLDAIGGFEYVPEPGYTGPDSFTYSLLKFGIQSFEVMDTATVVIDVQPTCAVSLVDDTYETAVDTDLHVGPPGPGSNDSLCDPLAELQVVTNPPNGAVTLLGSGDLTYTPNPGFVGTDTFTYTIAVAPQPFAFLGSRRPTGSPEPLATVTINLTPTTTATTTPVSTESASTTTPGTPTTTPGGGTLPPTGFLPATR